MDEFSGRKVLVVEDQEMFREALAFELEGMGFKVVTANDGQDGYQRACAETFDLILSDIKMPVWDGKQLLQKLRQNAHEPPFALMTGFADLSIQEAYDLGADAFLGKPLDPEKLRLTLRQLLLPWDQRWQQPLAEAELKLTKTMPRWGTKDFTQEIAFGRSGVCLQLEPHRLSLKVHERLGFNFDFVEAPWRNLSGSGVIIWKRLDAETRRMFVGMAFEYLAEPGRQALIQYLKTLQPRATIPLYNNPDSNSDSSSTAHKSDI